MGCSFRRIARNNMSILQGLPTTKCAPEQALAPARPPSSPWAVSNGDQPLLNAPSLRVVARTGVCFVARLDPIDIGPVPCASHPSRPGHNASRAYY